jgi:hypothetical protein
MANRGLAKTIKGILMKIIPFTQNPKQIAHDKATKLPYKEGFESALDSAIKTSNVPQARDIVVKENQRATLNALDNDLSEATNLLSTLLTQISEAGGKKLEKTHNLEGILYFFSA